MSAAELQALRNDYPNVFDIDSNLDRLVRKIELLSYVNPANIEKEKQRFFSSKYTEEPQFKYPKLKFDAYKLQRLFFSQRLERIKDEEIQKMYRDIVYYYANMIQCIETIGKGQSFYYNSLRLYGTPRERDVQNARYILHFQDEAPREDMISSYSALEAKAYFEAFMSQYQFPLHIKFSNQIAAEAMVRNRDKSLLLKRNAKFSKNRMETLANHEIGVHLVTTFNGNNQPLRIFANGLPKNVETQEGMAVLSEYMSGALTLERLKTLAYRVLASDSLIKGYSFADTFDLIHGQYKLDREAAFNITLRAHRGGGFTKDRLYLSGLSKMYKRYKKQQSFDVFLTGKVAQEFEDKIVYLQKLGLAKPITHQSHSFDANRNTNTTLDFILNNLK
ncbi:flavohemoglobin expression-modulating QEGLA motif protein [Croceivirga sp. JEA036]|uniref:flavohemoglobin expression-modulating QEGLA motif protein n=1 Tax=Croceivirga sp. JEA036 TaxID=2721162 RepID=UPI00143BBF81|nr:flavohemoglobin expression-modulating QEGLA motif protein [Croceivirga sp. JEA036]NJB35715.1 DUF1704 domain-containing protein [Croceivirga sp. JEA036]